MYPEKVRRYINIIEPWIIDKELDKNVALLKNMFNKTTDVVFRNFKIFDKTAKIRGILIYIDGLVNTDAVNRDILERIVTIDNNKLIEERYDTDGTKWMTSFLENTLSANNLTVCNNLSEVKDAILSAQAVLLIDGINAGIIAGVEGFDTRGINEPESSVVIRGPREGFTESLRTNTSLLRRKIKSQHLKTESLTIGIKTRTKICLMYLDNIINHKILTEVKLRLNRINIDAILESCYIEELIEDNPYSPFPSINTTERSDDAAAAVLEGRIIIIVDNTPFVLIIPMLFEDLLHSSDDYYNRYIGGSVIRLIRFVALFIALFLPSLYIAIVTFHPEMLPTTLLISVAAAREGVPFPAIVEALLMEITFEVLKEAGARMPKAIGSTVSIVGGLILGEAAVSAGLVSQPMVIIVAGTAIASFAIPGFGIHSSLRFLRFPFMILSSIVGLYGIILGFMVLLIHLCSLRSFGTSYMSPFAPLDKNALKDSFVRAPWWSLNYRPRIITWNRQRKNKTPKPSALILLLLSICSSILLTGCWDMEEINKRAIVAGVGLDLIEDENNNNKYLMTIQVIKPGVVAEEKGSGPNSDDAVWVISAEGKTIHDAARNMVRYSGRNLFWSHSLVIVVGEKLAQNDINPILDFFSRTTENRLKTWFIVAKEQQAKDVMASKSNLEVLSTVELSSMLKVREKTSFAAAINIKEFLYFNYQLTRSPVASVVETYINNKGEESLFVTGSAMFKDGKLQMYFDELTTRGILWVVGDVKGGIIPLNVDNINSAMSVEIINSKTNIKIDKLDQELNIKIINSNECKLTEIENTDNLDDVNHMNNIKIAVQNQIEKEILTAINIAKEQNADVFGIGQEVKRHYPQLYKQIESNWEEVFSQLKFDIIVNTNIKRYGIVQ